MLFVAVPGLDCFSGSVDCLCFVLTVALATVRTHTRNIYAKLGVNSRRAAVRRATELGLLSRTRDGRPIA